MTSTRTSRPNRHDKQTDRPDLPETLALRIPPRPRSRGRGVAQIPLGTSLPSRTADQDHDSTLFMYARRPSPKNEYLVPGFSEDQRCKLRQQDDRSTTKATARPVPTRTRTPPAYSSHHTHTHTPIPLITHTDTGTFNLFVIHSHSHYFYICNHSFIFYLLNKYVLLTLYINLSRLDYFITYSPTPTEPWLAEASGSKGESRDVTHGKGICADTKRAKCLVASKFLSSVAK